MTQCEYDVIISVETWLNAEFFYNEFFDTNLCHVFHIDRDTDKTQNLRCTSIRLQTDDSLLNQISVFLSGSTDNFLGGIIYTPKQQFPLT